jgi:small-conductance mechanosensitive channel
VGIGFGLQKVVSNLISGFILLSDGSVKPGDVVQIGEVYGWISSLKTRYVSVVTRDGIEYLIPNEDLITQQVINWSYSNSRVRLKVPFGVSYKSDPHQVQALVLSAMHALPRVLKTPPPVCLLQGFGDSSVDMELRVWINDPKNGVANLKSEVLFAVWDTLKENGIEIPFPQRDVHIISQPNPKPTESV